MSRSLILAVALCGCLTKDEKLALFDEDLDGFHTEASADWGGEAPWDCDDEDAATYPGAPEVCDEADNDCNGTTDQPGPDRPSQPDRTDRPCDARAGRHGCRHVPPRERLV